MRWRALRRSDDELELLSSILSQAPSRARGGLAGGTIVRELIGRLYRQWKFILCGISSQNFLCNLEFFPRFFWRPPSKKKSQNFLGDLQKKFPIIFCETSKKFPRIFWAISIPKKKSQLVPGAQLDVATK